MEYKGSLSSTNDLNSIAIDSRYGLFYSQGIPQNAPSGLVSSGIVITYMVSERGNPNVRLQIIISQPGNIYYRIKYSADDSWYSWKTL